MRIINGMIVGLATLMLASAASAALTVTVTSQSNLNAIVVGSQFTLDIEISTTAPEALALGLRAANYDTNVISFDSSVIAPSVFNFSPQAPFGGLVNSASGLEQPPLANVRAGTSVNLFQGVAVAAAAGAGPDSFSVTFTADAIGTTTVDIGAFADYSDTYSGGDGGQTPAAAVITIVPEPTSVASALAAVGSVFGVTTLRRRRAS